MRYLFLLLIIATCIGVFVMVIKPRYDGLETMREEVRQQTANLATAEQLKQSRQNLINEYNTISKEDLADLKTLLPDSVDNIRLIIQMDSLATKNGLSKLRSVDYQVAQEVPTPAQGSEVPAAKQPYGEFVMSFQTVGQYKNFLAFLSDLEYNLRLVDVTDVVFEKVTTTSSTGQSIASENMTYKVTLKTYWLEQ